MSRLYDEALLDAKKIREIAEQSAKDRIMESITPQIRKMINNRILFEQEDSELEDEEDLLPFDDTPLDDLQSTLDVDSIVDSIPDVDLDDDTAEKVLDAAADAAISVYAAGDVNIEVEQEEDSDEEDDLMTDRTMAEVFANLVRDDFIEDKNLANKINILEEKVSKLRDIVNVVREGRVTRNQQHRLELSFVSLVRETVSLQHDLKRSGRGSQRLDERLNSTIKEMREMSSKYKKNIFDFLFEAEDAEMKKEGMYEQDETETEEVDVEVDEEMGEEVDVDVDAASVALEDLGDALGLDLEIADEGDEGEEDLEDEEVLAGEEEVLEVNEAALRRELRRMRKQRQLREQEEATLEVWADPAQAEDLGDVIEVDEDDLINVLADELGSVDDSDTVVEESSRRRARRRSARRRPTTATATRKAIKEAATYKRAASHLKRQPVEMNLFNAKLLYANKLLQNKNLTVKQQRAIVEALDNAKTLREAKLLYKSLSGSLARRGRSGKTLSESVRRTLGSSSRSTRSGSSTKSGVETDRWAVLAGISKN